MNDLINRQAAYDTLTAYYHHKHFSQHIALKDALDKVPTIDPVKRGKWIKDGDKCALYKCTACNDLCTVAGWANCIPEEQMYKALKFCPNCGAQMERSEDVSITD